MAMEILKSLRIYLDANAIGHHLAKNFPDRLRSTQRLWDILEEAKCEVYVSPVTIAEIDDYENESKRDYLMEQLNRLNFILLPKNNKIKKLSKEYIEKGILATDDMNDSLHLAYATFYKCSPIISWNFRQINNPQKLKYINAINLKHRYGILTVYTATALLEILEGNICS
jgi:predicted nucleic acid-binding protein